MAAAEVILAHDIPVAFAAHAVPTQMSSYEVVERGAAAGVVITASHNPWTDNGFKVKSPDGLRGRPGHARGHRGGDRRGRAGRAAAVRRCRGGRHGRALRPVRGLRALRPPDGRPRCAQGRRRSTSSSSRCGARARAGSAGCSAVGAIRVVEIHQERNPFFGGVNPEPIRPNIDEALTKIVRDGHELGLLLDGDADRAGAADEQGTFIHQLEVTGLLMYYLAEHRGLRAAGRHLGQQHVDGRAARQALRHRGPREPGRLQVHRPADDRDRRDDGRRGVRRLRVRDAPARSATGSTPTCSCSTCSCGDGARRLARSRRSSSSSTSSPGPSHYRRVDVHVDRAVYPETKRRLLEGLVATPPTSLAGQPVTRTQALIDERWLQVLRRRRLVAAHPDVRDRAAGARLHGGDLDRRPGGAHRRGREARPRVSVALRDRRRPPPPPELPRRVDKPWGHEIIWALTDRYVGKLLVIETGKRLSLQHHEIKDEWIHVLDGRLLLTLENDAGEIEERELGPGEGAHVATLRVHRYEAIETCRLIEVSTPELDDVVRLEDDFGREGTSAPSARLAPSRDVRRSSSRREQILGHRRRAGALDERLPLERRRRFAGRPGRASRTACRGPRSCRSTPAWATEPGCLGGSLAGAGLGPALQRLRRRGGGRRAVHARAVPGRRARPPRRRRDGGAPARGPRRPDGCGSRRRSSAMAGHPFHIRYATTTGTVRIRWEGALAPTSGRSRGRRSSRRTPGWSSPGATSTSSGPATAPGFATWAGIGAKQARDAFEALAARR